MLPPGSMSIFIPPKKENRHTITIRNLHLLHNSSPENSSVETKLLNA